MAQQEPWDQGWDAEVAVPSWTSVWLQWLVAGRRHRDPYEVCLPRRAESMA